MMKLLIAVLLLTQPHAVKPKPRPPPRVAEAYDPDKLPPGEKSCGRPSAKRNVPCSCMEERIRKEAADLDKCQLIWDTKERYACIGRADKCRQVVTDLEHSYNEPTSENM